MGDKDNKRDKDEMAIPLENRPDPKHLPNAAILNKNEKRDATDTVDEEFWIVPGERWISLRNV